ncbi:MAG: TrkA family potassium uptake protein [Firmicutes bacterium]|nr:TrkA family potassium uptake protein [Bacillota bacterium]
MKNILIIGLGRFGRHTAEKLSELGHQVLAVDISEEKVNESMPFVTDAMIGDATKVEFLRSLGVSNFDVCIVAIGDDFQSSLEISSQLKELGASCVVSRASNGIHEKFLRRNGADDVIYPEKQTAEQVAIRYSSEYILDYLPVGNDFAVYEIKVPDDWIGHSLVQLDLRRNYHLNVVAIKSPQSMIVDIDPDMLLASGQTLLVMSDEKSIQRFVAAKDR